jgi:hypothetical protein
MRAKFMAIMLAGFGTFWIFQAPAAAANTELLELKNTIVNLVDELVKQGVISAEKAEAMKRDAALKAREQTAQADIAEGKAVPAEPAEAGGSVVRVPYVPEFVKDEIREDVRSELRQDVTNDVVAVAKAEKWGTPEALPAWVSRLEFSGDARLRGLGVFMGNTNNPTVPNFQAINEAGGGAAAGEDVFLNTTEDTTRGQIRLRLGVQAQLTDNISVTTRLATGNDTDPTTRNQRLGDYNRPFDIFVDQIYGEWRPSREPQAFSVRAGRLPNPFRSTALAFDDDLTFDGFTTGYRGELFGTRQALFVNAGIFTLLAEQPNLIDGGTDDKKWWGGQLGFDFNIADSLGLTVLGSYYDFVNVVGKRNGFNSTSRDWTAPAFIAKGNTVFDIRNDDDPESQLFALASEFELVNAMVELDYRGFDPVHVVLRGDYVQNLGFDEQDVAARLGTTVTERNKGWLTEIEVGHPRVREAGQWSVFAGYRYLQRDAVLDSFTDSDFHAGGTDAQGWMAGANFGLASNFWIRARWLSADEIDGAPAGFGEPFEPLAIDVLQVDLNAQF